jgi:hypothetical protein
MKHSKTFLQGLAVTTHAATLCSPVAAALKPLRQQCTAMQTSLPNPDPSTRCCRTNLARTTLTPTNPQIPALQQEINCTCTPQVCQSTMQQLPASYVP